MIIRSRLKDHAEAKKHRRSRKLLGDLRVRTGNAIPIVSLTAVGTMNIASQLVVVSSEHQEVTGRYEHLDINVRWEAFLMRQPSIST